MSSCSSLCGSLRRWGPWTAGWTVGAADILGGRPREAAPAEPLGQGQCVEVRRSLACLPARLQPETRRALLHRSPPREAPPPPQEVGFGFGDWWCGNARHCRVRVRVRRPAVRKRTPPPGSGSASGSQTGGAEVHAAAGFGFSFGFANRRVRVRTDRLVGSATGPLGKALIR
jgi:hypothetical protein